MKRILSVIWMCVFIGSMSATACCLGDCNSDGKVTVDEILSLINAALNGSSENCACPDCTAGTICVDVSVVQDAVLYALEGCPFTTPTVAPTPTPTVSITYRLTEGSVIISSPAPPGVNAPTLEEPLTGTFTVVRVFYFCPNTFLCLNVIEFQFQSVHFTVAGSDGQIQETTFEPNIVSMGLMSTINGAAISLGGSGPFDPSSNFPPSFQAVEICGAPPGLGGSCAGIRAGTDVGYDLILFATPGG